MKYSVYVHVLSIFTIAFSLFSLAFWRLSQDALAEMAATDPTSVVSGTDWRVGFTLATFLVLMILTFIYNVAPHYIRGNLTKKHVITATIITVLASFAEFAMLNITWQFAFIGAIIVIFEIITTPKDFALALNRTRR